MPGTLGEARTGNRPGLPDWRAWVAVAAGGLLGTELRYGAGLAFPETAGDVPWTTLVINVAGSFVLATLTTLWIARPRTAFWLRAGLGPGLLGSFTTFSAVVFSVDQQFRGGLHGTWLAYLGLSLVLGLGAAAAGWKTGKALADLRAGV
ncbi:CrcB protein [Arthrobacter sp. V4I6]|uniref:fluoride efflux transporter FluC n=1 Tax=unclassified Arthrobacter TaxID=235627 RepID=UPI0027802C04|nr:MULTISPECIES: CrcB family protein [unclassified Arthrobacter]MDQ0820249.1 CrcB protein [Arthrobacter sp. V1I7]MDQ0854432.1 CrcB protein [Arthrobacter sp. V4I6]